MIKINSLLKIGLIMNMKNIIFEHLTKAFNKLSELNNCNFTYNGKEYIGVPSTKTAKSTGTTFSILVSQQQFQNAIFPEVSDKIEILDKPYSIVKIEIDVATIRLFVEG